MNLAGAKAVSLGFPEDHPMGLDYSAGPINPPAIRATGFLFVLRYLAPLPNAKVISVAERQALHAGSVGVGLVWESYAASMGGGTTDE